MDEDGARRDTGTAILGCRAHRAASRLLAQRSGTGERTARVLTGTVTHCALCLLVAHSLPAPSLTMSSSSHAPAGLPSTPVTRLAVCTVCGWRNDTAAASSASGAGGVSMVDSSALDGGSSDCFCDMVRRQQKKHEAQRDQRYQRNRQQQLTAALCVVLSPSAASLSSPPAPRASTPSNP